MAHKCDSHPAQLTALLEFLVLQLACLVQAYQELKFPWRRLLWPYDPLVTECETFHGKHLSEERPQQYGHNPYTQLFLTEG